MNYRYPFIVVVMSLALISVGIFNAQAQLQSGWYKETGGAILASPLLVDLNNDGFKEVVVPSFDDKLYVYEHDGTEYSDATVSVPVTLGFDDGTISSVSAGDVDGDGYLELVVVGDELDSSNCTVKVFNHDLSSCTSKLLNAGATGKSTACLIDCYRYDSSHNRHSGDEIIIRDGNGNVHTLYYDEATTSLLDLYSSPSFDTCTDGSQYDEYGSQRITPSVSAVSLANDVTYLVVGSTDNKLYRWEVTSNSTNSWSVSQLSTFSGTGAADTKFLGSPVIADLNGDSDYEIVLGSTRGEVYVWAPDGSLETSTPLLTSYAVVASPAVANLDADSDLEIAVACYDGAVYVWDYDGSTLSQWSEPFVTMLGGEIDASPLLAELDGQAGLEILACSLGGYIHTWDSLGNTIPRLCKHLNTQIIGSPAIGDIHGYGRQAIVVAGYDGRVYVFDLPNKSLDVSAGWLQFRGDAKRQGSIQ